MILQQKYASTYPFRVALRGGVLNATMKERVRPQTVKGDESVSQIGELESIPIRMKLCKLTDHRF